jgi:hypothetical protein
VVEDLIFMSLLSFDIPMKAGYYIQVEGGILVFKNRPKLNCSFKKNRIGV